MADSWFFWILTCVISLYFVMLLLDFNKPSKKLMEQIDHQEGRRRDMTTRLAKLQEDIVKTKSSAEDQEQQLEDFEVRRKDLLPEANKRRMIEIAALGRSSYGVWDMSGNVYEWNEDYFDEDYYKYSRGANPRGLEGGQERVIRGGFFSETRPNVRTTPRSSAPETHTRENVGFRLALSPSE